MVVRLKDLRDEEEEPRNSGLVRLSDLRRQEMEQIRSIAPGAVDPFAQTQSIQKRFAPQTPQHIAKPTPSPLPSFREQSNNVRRFTPEEPELPGRDLPVVGPVLRGLDAFSNNPVVKKVGEIGGTLYTPGAGLANIGSFVSATRAGLSRVAPNIGLGSSLGQRVAREAITEGVMGVPLSAGNAVAQNPGISGRDLATQTALGTGLGVAGGAAAPAVGRLFSNLLRRNNVPEETVQEVLALPMGREDAARMRNQIQTPDVISPEYTFALPEGRGPIGTPVRSARSVNGYRQQFENLMQEAQRLQQEGRLTPGREDLELESLWSRMAGRDGVSLDELIQRAYPSQPNRITDDLVQRARQNQQNREVAGAPLPIRSSTPESGQVAPVAAPRTVPRITQDISQPPIAPRGPELLPADAPASRPRIDITQPPRAVNEPRRAPETPPRQETANEVVDDADDIELPQPDEIAPRVRDRVTSFADEMIEQARAELAKSRNRLSSNPVDVYGQYAKIGAGYMLKGSVKLADFTEQMVRDFGEEIRPHVRKIFTEAKKEYKAVNKRIESEELGLNGFDAQELKDLSNINLNSADVYRNFRKVFGKNYDAIKKSVLDPFDEAKGSYATEQKTMTDKLYTDIVKGLGIKKGSKESALVQQFGEGQIDLDTLKSRTKDWQKIVRADQWFRQQYDGLIDRVNNTVARIYPNRPEKLVPKRQDYYRHFQEMTAWSGLKNLFDTASARISPSLSGISPYTQPRTKWASFKQKRGLGEFKNDAVGGFLDYIPAASYAIHIDPQISVFRNLGKRLAEDTEQTANINNFIKFVNNFANDLSGKTSPLDRWVEELGGRKALQIVTQVNNRVKSNTILGNVGSVVAQAANIPNAIAYGGIDAVPGIARAGQSLFTPNEAMARSNFIKERYLDKSFRRFNQKWWEQPKKAAEMLLEIGDLVGTSITWNTAYAKGVRQKVADPIKFADEQSRRLLGGRGVGEQPLLIKSKVFNVIAPFQLEVNNMWRVMKDFVDEKQFGSLATLFAFNFLFNKAAEEIRGSGVTFDPIDAIYDAFSEEDISILQRTGRFGGEILSNLPLGQNLAAMYPEYGTNLYGLDLPTREQLFGEKDPTRFGEGLLVTKGIQDPIFKLLTPWGGGQLKKTIQGSDALARGGSFTDTILTTGLKIEEPSLRFPIDRNPVDGTRSILFGPYATSQGKEFTKLDRRPLTEKQTREYLEAPNRKQFYDDLMAKRREDTEKRKAKEAAAKNEKPK